MTRHATAAFLDDEIQLLVQHFGIEEVRASVDRFAGQDPVAREKSPIKLPRIQASPRTVSDLINPLRETDEEKYNLLSNFYSLLKEGKLLPQAEDFRHFATHVGIKQLDGNSRRSLIVPLMRYLVVRPTEKLRDELKRAEDISEEERMNGYSVLTEKLLRRD